MEAAEKIIRYVNTIVWGPAMLCGFLLIGILYSVKIRFFQLFGIRTWLRETIGSCFYSTEKSKKCLSPFKAMTTALAGAIGTGNIVGVAGAIALGGPGSVFWMWVAAFFGMATIFAENYLGVRFRQKTDGAYAGGPMYYIERGLHSRFLAWVFSIMCTCAALGMGNITQANSAAGALELGFGIDSRIGGAIIAILTGVVIFGGIERISSLNEKMIPLISVLFISIALIIIVSNCNKILPSIKEIISSAFGFQQAAGGFCGYTMATALKFGISRGVFSNEAGLGSSPIVHSASESTDPYKAGMWGIFQVFIDTMVMCTIMALCIMVTGGTGNEYNGIIISTTAFSSLFGSAGKIIVNASIFVFAFATLVSWCYYGEKGLEYLAGSRYITVYRIIYTMAVFCGAIMDISLVWELSETFNGLMAIPNLIALVLLSGQVKLENNKQSCRRCLK